MRATDTSREAVESFAQWAERTMNDEAADLFRALVAERDALRAQLASARNEGNGLRGALRQIFVRSSQVRPAHYEAAILKIEKISEDALKSTPAPREVTPQEAALERLAAELWKAEATDTGTPRGVVDGRTPEAFVDESSKTRSKWLKMAGAALRAIAQEGQSE